MRRHPTPACLVILSSAVLHMTTVQATVLTFDQSQPVVDGVPVDQSYGDAVRASTQAGRSYKAFGGYTPHVRVTYEGAAAPVVRTTGFGGLTNVLARGSTSSDPATFRVGVTLTADPGWTVRFYSFNAAANSSAPGVGVGVTGLPFEWRVQTTPDEPCVFPGCVILGGTGAPVEAPFTGVYTARHVVEAEQITLSINLTGLAGTSLEGAANSIGLDNLRFEERGAARYDPATPIATGEGGGRVVIADLDRDAVRDLIAISPGEGQVFWARHEDGRGTYGPEQLIASDPSGSPSAVVVGDLDRDGDQDVAVAWAGTGSVIWYANLGGGSFGDPETNGMIIGGGPSGMMTLEAADVEGDGDADLLLSSEGPDGVRWLLNDGSPADGGWLAQTVYGLGAGSGAEPADVDMDGDMDVVTLVSSDLLAWYRNDGAGVWTELAIESMAGPGRFTATDIDADGDADVLLARCGTPGVASENVIQLYHNRLRESGSDADGFDGGIAVAERMSCPDSLRALDVDFDGLPDLALATANATPGQSSLAWFRRLNGNGFFPTRLGPEQGLPGAQPSTDVLVEDMDGDGDLDFLTARADGGVEWHRNLTMHSRSEFFWYFTGAFRKQSVGMNELKAVAAADLDRDGRLDWVTGGNTRCEIHVLEGTGEGFTTPGATISDSCPKDIALADLDQDGREDIVVAGDTPAGGTTGLRWFRNLGESTPGGPVGFDAAREIHPGGIVANVYRRLAVGDLDGDGDLDVVAASPYQLPGGNHAEVYFNDGSPVDGGWTLQAVGDNTLGAVHVALGDLNRDGRPDILTAAGTLPCNDQATPRSHLSTCNGPWSIQWFANMPELVGGVEVTGFTAQPAIPVSTMPQFVMEVTRMESFWRFRGFDLEDDGLPDILVGSARAFTLHRQQGDGSFGPEIIFFGNTNVPTPSVVAEDFIRDGTRDLGFVLSFSTSSTEGVGLCEDGSGLVWGCGRVDRGTTASPVGSPTVVAPAELIAADLDGDGDADLAIPSRDYLWLWRNQLSQATINRIASPAFSDQVSETRAAFEGELALIQNAIVQIGSRPGEAAARLEAFGLQFVDTSIPAGNIPPGVPLTSAQANALIDEILVYRDQGGSEGALPPSSGAVTGQFDPAGDLPLLTITDLNLDSNGILAVNLPPADPNLIVAAPARFHVAARIALGATLQTPKDFRVRLTGFDEGPVLKDVAAGTNLRTEFEIGTGWLDIQTISEIEVDALQDLPDTNTGDAVCNVGGGECSLRAAVQEANGRAGDNRIDLPAGTFTLGAAGQNEDAGVTGDLDVTDTTGTLLIHGAGAGVTFIDAAGLDRVFDVLASARLTLEDLTLVNGNAGTGDGGALRVASGAKVTLTRCEVTGSSAASGGGIWSRGTNLTVQETHIHDNQASGRGGGLIVLEGSTVVVYSTVSGNAAGDDGGGISVGGISGTPLGDIQLVTSTISGNESAGEGGGLELCNGTLTIHDAITITGNTAASGGGIAAGRPGCAPGTSLFGLGVTSSLILGNNPGSTAAAADCLSPIQSSGFNLGPSECFTPDAGSVDQILASGSDPGLGPLQNNGGPTPTHALRSGSLAIDAGASFFNTVQVDQRGIARVDIPGIANFSDGNGNDVGAYEIAAGDALSRLEVPIRWCALEGSPSFDFNQPPAQLQAEVNDALRERHELASDNIYGVQAAVRFRSAGSASAPNFPILPDRVVSESCPAGKVVIQPEARDFKEFVDVVAQCRQAWEALDPGIKGVTAVNIDQFVDPNCQPLDILGLGGRAEVGDAAGQMAAGRVMVVDRVHRAAANPPDLVDRLLAHELGHGVGALQHGNGVDDFGSGTTCADGQLDNDDDKCSNTARFDGPNIMQYRSGTQMTRQQVDQMRLHILSTLPDVDVLPSISGLADEQSIDEEFLNILDFEFLNVLDFEFLNILDFEFLNVLDFEFLNVLDFEEAEILDFEFLNILDFGMTFTDTTAAGTTTLYATTAGLPWPTPIRPTTAYYWYLDLDLNDATGGLPALHGFPGGQAQEQGVELIVALGFSSTCDASNVCSDSVLLVAYAWNQAANTFQPVFGPVPAEQYVAPLTVGLIQETTLPEREDQALGMLLKPTLPNSILLGAAPAGSGYAIGNPVSMEVVAALACEQTLPDGTSVDCQCTSCGDCPGYPGCENPEDPEAVPASVKQCTESGLPCRDQSGCTSDPGDVCSGENTYIVGDEPGGVLGFESPVLPSCEVLSSPVFPGTTVFVRASSFPVGTGRAMKVFGGTEQIGFSASPVFDAGGATTLRADIPSDALSGSLQLRVVLEGLATTASCFAAVEFPEEGDCIGGLASGDTDGDGYCNDTDLCPTQANADQADADGDLIGDVCDACPADPGNDADGDTVCAADDNCPLLANPSQANRDGDDLGDACDPDPIIQGVVNDGPVDEGSPVTVSVSADPPSLGGTLSYLFDCDGDLGFDVGPSAMGSAECAYADEGDYTVNVRVTAGPDGVADATTVVSVLNAAPLVGAITAPVEPVPVGAAVAASATFTDAGVLDTHSASWNWGDGSATTTGTVAEPAGTTPGSVTGNHAYTVPGVYTVQLTVTDDSGDSGQRSFLFVVVYDPNGAFVTGGGYINSPAGAYPAEPQLTGRANLGFVARYKKGSTVPLGGTEFEFEVAGMLFESVSYQWLVVAGHKAQFKGVGTINGAGDYGFLLFAVDELLSSSIDEDRFRIKIWDRSAGDAVVYDNELGAAEDAEATTALGGGAIVIHEVKK